MPSKAAKEALTEGNVAWKSFLINNKNLPIDLSFIEIFEYNLSSINFIECDLTGAVFETSSLDNSVFMNSILNGIKFNYTSLIGCKFDTLTFERSSFKDATLRNSIFSNVIFKNVDFSDVNLNNCTFNSCQFKDCTFKETCELSSLNFVKSTFADTIFEKTTLSLCKFQKVAIDALSISKSSFKRCSFTSANISNFEADGGSLNNVTFTNSTINKLFFNGTNVESIDLTNSTMIDSDVVQINPSTAILLNTSFISCRWPSQEGKISLLGKYMPSKYLINQPVQDIRGINPLLRREIADAQFLVNLTQRKNNLGQKFLIRIWGFSTAFGQSALRLTIFSVLIIIIISLVFFMQNNYAPSFTKQALEYFITHFSETTKNVFYIFIGLEPPSSTYFIDSKLSSIIIIITRAFGFVVLGLWMTIVANKIVNLASK